MTLRSRGRGATPARTPVDGAPSGSEAWGRVRELLSAPRVSIAPVAPPRDAPEGT